MEQPPFDLTPDERDLLAVALLNVAMRQGPLIFRRIDQLAAKLGLEDDMKRVAVTFATFALTGEMPNREN